jgi:hypothetical protein
MRVDKQAWFTLYCKACSSYWFWEYFPKEITVKQQRSSPEEGDRIVLGRFKVRIVRKILQKHLIRSEINFLVNKTLTRSPSQFEFRPKAVGSVLVGAKRV